MIGMVKLRILETDSKFRLRGDTLKNAIHVRNNLFETFCRYHLKFLIICFISGGS